MNATLVVLGDLGRSPRMQYHALELIASGASVRLIGWAGERVIPELARDPRATVRRLAAPVVRDPRRLPRLAYVAYSFFKLARLTLALAAALLAGPRPDVMLVQVPPALPTLAVALLLARLRGSRLVVDWHNFGSPLVERTLGEASALARLHRWLERGLGRRADVHLCVSAALQQALAGWGVSATVLHDRPSAAFRTTPPDDALAALRALGIDAEPRPLVVVSPTGWTDEEDFDLLLDALGVADAGLASAPGSGAELVVALTGRGPLRAAFEARVLDRAFARMRVVTAWLEGETYPRLLGACDVGLSLHRSTSGLDLAMKVEDLLGSGLPVLALDHGSVREQLPPGSGGWLVTDAAELGRAFVELARGGRDGEILRRLRGEVRSAARPRFGDEWRACARPILLP